MPPKKPAEDGFVALRLKFPGAPETWHTVPDAPGLYHPTIPTLSDEVGLTVDEANELAKNLKDRIEVVDPKEVHEDSAREAYEIATTRSKIGVRKAARNALATEGARINHEHIATQVAKED